MDFTEFRDKRVVVTGCSSGIGRATAGALLELRAHVIGLGLQAPDVELSAFERLDLVDPTSIEDAVVRLRGPVDVLLNCAGGVPMMDPVELLKVNFLGTRLLTERVVETMPAGGAVVNTSSDGGHGWRAKLNLIKEFLAADGFEGGLAWYRENIEAAGHGYAFGKQALNVWTMQQSQQLIHRGIRINSVSPGAVQTPMLEAIEAVFPPAMIAATEQPIGRRSSAQEQVGPLLFLASAAASYVNGADLAADGGCSASLNLGGGTLW